MRTCTVCRAPIVARPHRRGIRRRYLPSRCAEHRPKREAEWFLRRLEPAPAPIGLPGECWIWTGERNKDGYATYRGEYLHRLVFRKYYGRWPITVDHLCNRPPCLNPKHMESVTLEVNRQRAVMRRALKRVLERSGRSSRGTRPTAR